MVCICSSQISNLSLLSRCHQQWPCCHICGLWWNRRTIHPINTAEYPQPPFLGGMSGLNTAHTITWLILTSYRGHGGHPRPESESVSHFSRARLFATSLTVAARLHSCPWNSPDRNTRVGSPSLLQGIFLTQGSNLGLQHCRPMLYHLSQQGSPKWSNFSAHV